MFQSEIEIFFGVRTRSKKMSKLRHVGTILTLVLLLERRGGMAGQKADQLWTALNLRQALLAATIFKLRSRSQADWYTCSRPHRSLVQLKNRQIFAIRFRANELNKAASIDPFEAAGTGSSRSLAGTKVFRPQDSNLRY